MFRSKKSVSESLKLIIAMLVISIAFSGCSSDTKDDDADYESYSAYDETETTDEITTDVVNDENITDFIPDETTTEVAVETPYPAIWTDREITDTDLEGYKLNYHLHISNFFSYKNEYEELSNTWRQITKTKELPSKDLLGFHSGSYDTRDGHINADISDVYYAVGYIEITNQTEGFDITSDNPKTLNVVVASSAVTCHMRALFSGTPMTYYGDYATTPEKPKGMVTSGGNVLIAKMTSNNYGPLPIVIAFPVNETPNNPRGVIPPEEVRFRFGPGFGISIRDDGQEPFTLPVTQDAE